MVFSWRINQSNLLSVVRKIYSSLYRLGLKICRFPSIYRVPSDFHAWPETSRSKICNSTTVPVLIQRESYCQARSKACPLGGHLLPQSGTLVKWLNSSSISFFPVSAALGWWETEYLFPWHIQSFTFSFQFTNYLLQLSRKVKLTLGTGGEVRMEGLPGAITLQLNRENFRGCGDYAVWTAQNTC